MIGLIAVGCHARPATPAANPLASLDAWPDRTVRQPAAISSDPSVPGTLAGIVTDDSGHVLKGARVLIDAQAMRTDSLGRVRFAVGAGQVVVKTAAIGYLLRTDTLTVPGDRGLNVTLPLAVAELDLGPICTCGIDDWLFVIKVNAPPRILAAGEIQISATFRSGKVLRDTTDGASFASTHHYWSVFPMRDKPGAAPDSLVDVTIAAHGFRVWRDTTVQLTSLIVADLVPERRP